MGCETERERRDSCGREIAQRQTDPDTMGGVVDSEAGRVL